MSTDKLIGVKAIAKLAGSTNPRWALNRQRELQNFPVQVQGGRGCIRSKWREHDILNFLASYTPPHRRNATYQGFDNETTQQVIRLGWRKAGKALKHHTQQQEAVYGH